MKSVQEIKELYLICNELKQNPGDGFNKLEYFFNSYLSELSDNEKWHIFDIMQDALKHVNLKGDESEWIKKRSFHFGECSTASEKWRKKFSQKDFNYKDLDDLMDFIKNNINKKNINFMIGIPGSTLSEDVVFGNDIQEMVEVYVIILKNIAEDKYK